MHREHVHDCRSRHADFTLPGAVAHYPPDLRIEPVHLLIEYRVDLAAERVDGQVTHTLRGHGQGGTRLVLHAVDFHDVTCTDTEGRAVAVRYDGREITIDWHEPFANGEERRLVVRFHLQSPTTGLFFSRPTPELPDRAWYAATDNETERARHWLPTIDLPSVRPTLEFRLTADARFTILANGALVGETTNADGTRTAHWLLGQPCPSYLTCFAIGEFVRHDDGEFEGRPVASFAVAPHTSEDLGRSFGRTRRMLEWMQAKLGHAFPYPKYFQFALPGFGGAMENVSLVSWDDNFVTDATLAREFAWLVDKINVHEMGHSYFGDLIVCRDFAHAWLKESWATYMEQLWLEDALGADEGRHDFLMNVLEYCDEADSRYRRPIVTRTFDHSWHMYDRHLYPGGAARLHMLRKELGDDVFFEGVRTYVKRFAFRTVETDDFRRTLEEVSGRSLGRWFDQWIHGKGYPKIKASFAHDAKSGLATFTVEQTQVDAKEGVPAFEMPLDLGWVVDGALTVRTVQLDKARHVFVFPLATDPQQVLVDPHARTVMSLEFDPGEDKLLAQLRDPRDVVARIRAVRTLLVGGRRKRVEAVRDAYRAEPFWGVRVQMARALAKCATQPAVLALAELIGEEQDGMVLDPLLRAAGTLRAREIGAAIEARLDAGLDLYRARQAAYEALGAQRGDAPFERLAEAARTDVDRYGFVRAGALRGVAATRRPESVAIIDAATSPGAAPSRVRPPAAAALGTAGRSLERHLRGDVRERLERLLRDPVGRVRENAVAGLAALGEPAAIGALETYSNALSDQERAGVARIVAGLRGAAAAQPHAKDEALDELRRRIRTLEETVDKLGARLDATSTSTSQES